MLLSLIDQFQVSPAHAVITLTGFVVAIVAAITVHEFSHALTANLLGDDTAKEEGRLTLNPLSHLDPMGTAMIVFVGFGWGRPTPVNPALFRSGARPGIAAVSVAGPISNVIAALAVAIPFRFGLLDAESVGFSLFRGDSGDVTAYVLGSIIFINILLAAFNLIPIAPLDGFKVVLGILPRDLAIQWNQLERWGPLILLGIILSGFILPGRINLLIPIMRPLVNGLSTIVVGGQIWG